MSLFFVSFAVCFLSLAPSIHVGDSALFSVASYSLGSAHPPGYPLFIILGKLLTFIPLGNIAFKVNLLSALMAALAAVVVYKISHLLTESPAASWSAALTCAISPVFFPEALKAEVYTLNALLCSLIFYSGLKLLKGGDFLRYSLFAFFLAGLGTGNHHTIALAFGAVLLPVALRWREISPVWLISSLLIFLAGASVNLLIYFRSLVLLDRGVLTLYSQAFTPEGLLNVILRRAYKAGDTLHAVGEAVSSGKEGWMSGTRNAALYIILPSIRPVLPFFVIGLAVLLKKGKLLAYFLLSLALWFALLPRLVLSGTVPTADAVQTSSPFFASAVPVLYALVAMGIAGVIRFFERKSLDIIPRFLPVAAVLVPFALLPFSLRDASLNNNYLAYDYGRDILTTMPVKSLLMNYADNPIFAAFYMRGAERLREDVLVMDTASKKDVYSLGSSPAWKYAVMYPEFYGKRASKVSEVNREFALNGKLFANSPERLTFVVAKHYSHYPYLLTVFLYPPRTEAEDDALKELFRARYMEAFPLLNVERVMEAPYRADLLSRELFGLYGFSAMYMGDLLNRKGDSAMSVRMQRLALELSEPQLFLWPYANFLISEGRAEEALSILGRLESSAYAEYAAKLKQKAMSVIGLKEGR